MNVEVILNPAKSIILSEQAKKLVIDCLRKYAHFRQLAMRRYYGLIDDLELYVLAEREYDMAMDSIGRLIDQPMVRRCDSFFLANCVSCYAEPSPFKNALVTMLEAFC